VLWQAVDVELAELELLEPLMVLLLLLVRLLVRWLAVALRPPAP